jgi:hypothetical protein
MTRDPVMIDLATYEREQAEGELLMEEAEQRRKELVAEFIADEHSKNQRTLVECLTDLVGCDAEFLHALQRGDVQRMQRLLNDYVDFYWGDELVVKEAERIGADRD